MMLAIGIPREIKPGERRVALTPEGVRRLREEGVQVFVEKGAGEGCHFSDEDYRRSGGEILGGARELFGKASLIKKIKEPVSSEWQLLKEGQLLFSFLHLASPENQRLMEALCKRRVIAVGLETVEKDGRAIFLEPMSEIAGVLAATLAGFFRTYVRVEGKKIVYPPRLFEKLEELASQFPDAPERLSPGKGVVFGGGVVGRKAVEMLLKMGGEVDLVEKRADRRKRLEEEFHAFKGRFRTWGLEDDLSQRLREADVWIGCVHVLGERAPWVMEKNRLEELSRPKPKLILDIAVDQGGNFPGTHSTSYEDPLYLDPCGNLRFGVTNVPSLAGRGASEAIEKLTIPYTVAMARNWREAFREFPELRGGLQIFRGKVVHEAVARAHGVPCEPVDLESLER